MYKHVPIDNIFIGFLSVIHQLNHNVDTRNTLKQKYPYICVSYNYIMLVNNEDLDFDRHMSLASLLCSVSRAERWLLFFCCCCCWYWWPSLFTIFLHNDNTRIYRSQQTKKEIFLLGYIEVELVKWSVASTWTRQYFTECLV